MGSQICAFAPKRGVKAPSAAKKKQAMQEKVANPLFEKRPKRLVLKVRCPLKGTYSVREMAESGPDSEEKVPPALNQFIKTLDKNLEFCSGLNLCQLSHNMVHSSCGVHLVNYSWLKADPCIDAIIEMADFLTDCPQKTASVLCLTESRMKIKLEFSRILEAFDLYMTLLANFNDKLISMANAGKWGGAIISKSQFYSFAYRDGIELYGDVLGMKLACWCQLIARAATL
ncbi:60S ribosomal protein L7a-1-like [Tripterygium wilfordii]|uniref:60S ribosomal protein L7a-1-like n=1 Tax=Tripterygium wilfordii TaxID=458696 RepID=UPI0018F864C3|nr:60S ribosomal protein L7a-1-like [Tripterygium wilfordii]